MFAACGVEEESKTGRVAVVEMLLLKFCFSAKADFQTLAVVDVDTDLQNRVPSASFDSEK